MQIAQKDSENSQKTTHLWNAEFGGGVQQFFLLNALGASPLTPQHDTDFHHPTMAGKIFFFRQPLFQVLEPEVWLTQSFGITAVTSEGR